MKNLLISAILILVLVLPFTGCKKDKQKETPVIPPESTFVMDFSGFKDADTTGGKQALMYINFVWAATNVLYWNAFVSMTMAVPVASFREAFNHEAIYNPDLDEWTWSYNFSANNVVYLAVLHASYVTDGISWKMYISKDGSFTNFLWYSGISNLDNTSGYWTLYYEPNTPVTLVQITWTRDPASNTGDIKYENIIPANPESGSYIHYGITTSTEFDAFYKIYSKSLDNLTDILWHRTNKNGKVKDPHHFGDPEWHCWGTDYQDTVCP